MGFFVAYDIVLVGNQLFSVAFLLSILTLKNLLKNFKIGIKSSYFFSSQVCTNPVAILGDYQLSICIHQGWELSTKQISDFFVGKNLYFKDTPQCQIAVNKLGFLVLHCFSEDYISLVT